MTFGKRLFDILLALALIALLIVPALVISIWLLIRQGRPVLFLSERMKTSDTAFLLWKFRTMTVVADDAGVSGGDKTRRITPAGRFLRRTRLDEVPQLWNVLIGDMSFVGPRPPLRRYVDRYPEIYARVLKSRPGITGLATLHFHRHEERLLSACRTPEETEAVYERRCIPRKARLDLIYRRRQTVCLDIILLYRTARRVFLRR